jgi:hypothetical protein
MKHKVDLPVAPYFPFPGSRKELNLEKYYSLLSLCIAKRSVVKELEDFASPQTR